ncbi:flagellar brake protein [Bacterioplanoides sp. SCSIO 12839]|uniref:flagellar brake protein n=1 Tax=Bacterioplanoides sp. SCSIO 12839 TaxID=2829569 RepID=UPI0021033374|nr:flagellar brake protein [Bacterioplanoides sp. SCSIO 12839]UTW49661.1 flagellar brake protein [Bacterioplanoides sp. SCSIO 12839]
MAADAGKPKRFEELKLLPGQAIQLEFDGYSDERDRSSLVGYMAGRSIIVSTPMKNGSPLPLKNGMPLAVRFFAAQWNSACAFKTEVIHVSRIPFAHIHLAMPKELVLGEVRSSVRAKVSLICSVLYGTEQQHKVSARITDLSLGGARIVARQLPVVEGDNLTITAQVSVSGVDRIIKVSAIVRSVNTEETQVAVGVQFQEMSDSDRITLHAYVLTNLNT